MSIDHVLFLITDPKSVYLEIIFKYFKSKKFNLNKKKITIVGDSIFIKKEAKKNNFRRTFNQVKDILDTKKNFINILDVKLNKKIKAPDFSDYISVGFEKCISIIKKNKKIALLNGPINKKKFLKKKYLGITEYLAKKTNTKNPVMLIYNNKISVSPITTHLPIKHISKNIKKFKIIKNIRSINSFYKNYLRITPKIAVLGLNPHCETTDKIGEEEKAIVPAIKKLKKDKISVRGPFSADTFFIKKNIDYYDVVIGMYHNQALTPLKTLYNFNAINITIGLPFIRVSPDHGPNVSMYGKNKSDPSSIFCAMDFFNKIK